MRSTALVKDSTDEMTCLLSHLNTWTLGLYLADSKLWSCPYDYGIDLLPGRMPPRGWLYFLSQPEMVAMEMYIHESLAEGIIHPSSSPIRAGFFLVQKNGSVHPCIDFSETIPPANHVLSISAKPWVLHLFQAGPP